MDIAALSTSMSMANLQTELGAALMSEAMDLAEVTGDGIQKMLEAAVCPNLGQNIDVLV